MYCNQLSFKNNAIQSRFSVQQHHIAQLKKNHTNIVYDRECIVHIIRLSGYRSNSFEIKSNHIIAFTKLTVKVFMNIEHYSDLKSIKNFIK